MIPHRVPPDPIFLAAPDLGFETGTEPEQICRFLFEWPENRPPDWLPRFKLIADDIAGGNRVLVQDLGVGELTLTTGLAFADAAAFHRFYRNSRSTGTLRMRRRATAWPPDREVVRGGVVYAEFDGVRVAAPPSAITTDNAGVVRCTVTFARPDRTWGDGP